MLTMHLIDISLIQLLLYVVLIFLFFFNDTATTEIYTLSLHDALPICTNGWSSRSRRSSSSRVGTSGTSIRTSSPSTRGRSEEHTSELQSRQYLVCRLLLEKKKKPRYCDINY